MKKKLTYIALAVIGIVLLTSFTYSKKEGGRIPTDAEEMRTLHYNGHQYVCYRYYHHSNYNFLGHEGRAGTSGASIIHDPDCPCQHQKQAGTTNLQ